MANKQRQRRVEDQLQKELSEIIRLELKDPGVGMVTITAVEVSPDLAHAKVLFTQLGDDAARKRVVSGLGRASSFLRTMLGKRIRLHNTPELHFHYDESIDRGIHLSRLIDEALKPVSIPSADSPQRSDK
jgi:ribosome-binding factor A